jgi:uncharacterized membrane protein
MFIKISSNFFISTIQLIIIFIITTLILQKVKHENIMYWRSAH